MKIKFRQIFGFFLAAALIMLFAASVLYVDSARSSMWNSLTLSALELTKSGAESLSTKLDCEGDSLENLIWILTNCSSQDTDEIETIVRNYPKEDDIEIEVFDPSHRMAYTTVVDQPQSMSDSRMEKIADYGDSGWILPFYSSYDGQRYIGYYARFQFTDGAQGIVRKDIDSKALGEKYSLTFYNGQGYSYVVDQTGDIIVRPQDRNSNRTFSNVFDVLSAGSNSSESLATLQESIAGRKSGILYCDFEGESSVIAFSSIEGTDGWSVLSLIPASAFTSHLDSMMRVSYMVIISLAILIVVMLSYLFYRSQLRERERDNQALLQTAQTAEAASLAKSEFLSHMSHDIRTPINGIMGMTGIALKNIDNKQRVQDCLHKIDSSSHHLLSLVNDVLDMSRIEAGQTHLLHHPFDLRTCLANCSSIICGQLATREIIFIKEFQDFPCPHVIGDELHLQQIFINILGNAVKFTPDGKRIFFRASYVQRDDAAVFHFEVEDEGIGMKPEYLPHLFDVFSQEDGGTRTHYKGTGIGMAITKSLVELMGGTIHVTSTLHVGTKFVLEIPLELDTSAPEEHQEQEDIAFHLKGMKILLVEDNELNMEIAKEVLECEGVAVTCAQDGQAALDCYCQSPPGTFDAILMDLMMPVMDGLTAAKKIRSLNRPEAKTIPILAMTANAFDADIQKSREAGMNAHLSKPIEVDVLYSTLAKFYRRKERNGNKE